MSRTASLHWASVLIVVFVSLAALKIAENIAVPMTLALVIGIVLSPVPRFFERVGLPTVLGAFTTLIFAVGALTALYLLFEPLVSRIIENAPSLWLELRLSIQRIAATVHGLDEIAKEVNDAIGGDGNGDSAESPTVPSLSDALAYAPALAGQFLVFIGTFFFFVLCKDDVYEWLGRQRTASGQPMTSERLLIAEHAVSRYFLTITLINAAFGMCVGVTLYLVGMPQPVVLGFLAFLLNFIPYLGPIVLAIGLAVAGQLLFTGPAALLPPLLFIGLNMLEGYFATPMLVGRHLSVNPLVVFVSLTFWLWLWGPAGGIIALPLTIWVLTVGGFLSVQTIASGSTGTARASSSAGPSR